MTPNIVCGIDQSPEARAATRLAAALTERLNGRLSLVHAVAASASSAMPSWPYPASIGDTSVRGSLHEAGERLMSETLEDIARATRSAASRTAMRRSASAWLRRRRTPP